MRIRSFCPGAGCLVTSALDKLLGQLGTYATWVNWVLTQPGYPQLRTCKNNCVFSYFFRHVFFFCDNTLSYCMKPSGMCLHIYSLPSSAFLKYQTRGFYWSWSKSHPLVDIRACIYFAKFQFHLGVFPRNTGLGTDIFIKLEYIARSLVKIKSIPDCHLFISRTETKWTKWYAMKSHVIAYRSLELLFGTHTFHFNCFFDDFNCVFTQIRCLSRVLTHWGFQLLLKGGRGPSSMETTPGPAPSGSAHVLLLHMTQSSYRICPCVQSPIVFNKNFNFPGSLYTFYLKASVNNILLYYPISCWIFSCTTLPLNFILLAYRV